jgi:hypothetical protein
MNKAHFLLLLLSFLLLSCLQKKDFDSLHSSGEINSISVMIDEQLWNGAIGDSIRNKFASPVIGLPQEEPLFTIQQYPVKLLEGYRTNSRNIIVVKKVKKSHFGIKENEFVTPQNIIQISGKTTQEILDTLEKYTPTIIQKIRQTEIQEKQRIIDTALTDCKPITKRFNISLKIPKGYKYVLKKSKFLWLKKEINSGNTSILIYQIPIHRIAEHPNKSVINNIIKMRDSIGTLYLHGTVPNSRMMTEAAYAPYLFNIKIDKKPTYEIKGTWELKNDYMSGPFINYCITDSAQNRILVLEGFCYAPSKEKRDLMFELEAIIKSIAFLKNKRQ